MTRRHGSTDRWEPGRPGGGASWRTITWVGLVAVGFAVVMIAVGWRGYHQPTWAFAVAEVVGLSFMATGWVAWYQRPDNRLGPLMMVAGGCWYLTNLQFTGVHVLYALGYWLTYVDIVVLAHVALAYPDGRVKGRGLQWLLASAYASYLILQGGRYLTEGSVSPIGWHPSPLSRWADLLSLNALVYGTLFWMVILWRWERADRATRRRHGKVWTGILLVNATLGAGAAASLAHRGDIGQIMLLAYGLGLVALPFVVLSSVLHGRLARGRVADLVIALEAPIDPPTLRRLLAEAIGDSTLELLFRSEGGDYANIDGRAVSLPDPARTDRMVTFVADGDHQLAALVHDPIVADRPGQVRAVVAAARLALSNARLQALQLGQIEELQSSRKRIALAALGERRRIERDLHDGAQQRLLRLSWLAQRAKQLVTGELPGAGDEVPALLGELVREVALTTTELRELAQGLYPQLLTERGLAVAIDEYALRFPLVARVDLPATRFSDVVETTAFFIIMEAIVNAAKHAQTDCVDVTGRVEPGRLVVDIRDEGVGGADPLGGTGLRNMADRLSAIDGTLSVDSPAGRGTHLRVVLPCE
jgi:signal transduction histidine kinase